MAHIRGAIRLVSRLVSPGGLLLFMAWGIWQAGPARAAVAPYTLYFCYGALAAVGLVGWFYDRGRILFGAAAIGLSVWGLGVLAAGGELPKLAIVFLLPLNLALLGVLEERGILSFSGLFKIAILLAQGFGVVMAGGIEDGRLEAFLRWGEPAAAWTWMPVSGLLAYAFAGVALLVLWFRRRTKLEAGLFWAVAATFVAMNHVEQPGTLQVYAGAAAVILLAGLLEHGYDVAYLDALTGLPARRAFDELLQQLSGQYAMAMCDVDHFKKFNDTYGHEVGDQVLRMVASKLSRVGGGGRVFRYGGEEFTVVFPGFTADRAVHFVEALRGAVADSKFILRGKNRPRDKPEGTPREAPGETPEKTSEAKAKTSVSVTISMGVADREGTYSTPAEVIEAADAALYRAKGAGRNCVKTA